MIEPVNDNILNLVNELYNNLDAKDKIINEQALEIARLNRVEKEYIYEHRLYEKEIAKLKKDIELIQNDLDNANSKLSDLMKSHLEAIEYTKVLRTSPSYELDEKIDEFLEILGENNGK